jgi:hypothetical protein
LAAIPAAALAAAASAASAQIEITELLFNPLNENVWEWIEVRNNGPQVDLNGYFADRLGDVRIPVGANPNVASGVAQNTVLPAGGVAVLYDGFQSTGNPANYNDAFFRQAWGLAPTVPLVAVDFWPELVNGGTAVGFWPNYAAYELDLVDNGTGTFVVGSFAHAAFSIDYRSGFPASDGKASVQWNGVGSNQNGAAWSLSTSGVDNAVASVQVAAASGSINSTLDIGNPGVLPGGAAPSGKLLITEIMYNPTSTTGSNEWEWIEVYNHTGGRIDFAATQYVLDDLAGANLAAPNVVSGAVPNASAAVLYNADLMSPDVVRAAWDPGGVRGTNFIPVVNWSPLNNTGDTVGLWSSLADYVSEGSTTAGRTFDRAVASVAFDDGEDALGNFWPADDGRGSIWLSSLAADPANGNNWNLASASDLLPSFNATAIPGTVVIHAGGDVGSPGVFGPSLEGDFNGDGKVDGGDFAFWQTAFPATLKGGDLLAWQRNFAPAGALAQFAAVPEPMACGLVALAGCLLLARRRDLRRPRV